MAEPRLRGMDDPSGHLDCLRACKKTDDPLPGADLLTAWYKRNAYICANIVQLAKPGDRVVVFYGSGHAFLLRQCVSGIPGFKLVEANDYLPK